MIAIDQQALVPTAVRQVNFHGDVITVVLVEERGRRQVYVLLRPLCQYLGLSWSSQLQRLREDDVLSEATTSVLLSNTEVGHRQRYTMIGLQLEFLPGWMFSFTPKRVRADLQEKVKRYRRDCLHVLRNRLFSGGGGCLTWISVPPEVLCARSHIFLMGRTHPPSVSSTTGLEQKRSNAFRATQWRFMEVQFEQKSAYLLLQPCAVASRSCPPNHTLSRQR